MAADLADSNASTAELILHFLPLSRVFAWSHGRIALSTPSSVSSRSFAASECRVMSSRRMLLGLCKVIPFAQCSTLFLSLPMKPVKQPSVPMLSIISSVSEANSREMTPRSRSLSQVNESSSCQTRRRRESIVSAPVQNPHRAHATLVTRQE